MASLWRTLRGHGGAEQRYSFDQWAQEYMTYGGTQYPLGFQTTYGKQAAEVVPNNFAGYVQAGLKVNGPIWALTLKRLQVFSQARFLFQRMGNGRPQDMFFESSLRILEEPWTGGVTGDLLARMLLDADFAGNSYEARYGGELIRLRPDWVEIILEPREVPLGANGATVHMGYKRAGYFYYEGGRASGAQPAVLLPNEVCHYAPYPDPEATYRGMSWMTPVIREIQADQLATTHKKAFFENAATPNLAVSLPKELTKDQFLAFVAAMDSQHKGAANAYKTMYTGGGADVTVIGANMQQLDFRATQGAGETRLAAAAGVPAVIVGFSEGMQGSSLNAGNYQSAKRNFADTTISHLWQNAAGSLQVLVPPPDQTSRLWVDGRDIPFLREDQTDAAEILAKHASTIRTLTDAGYTAESVTAAVIAGDFSLLVHSGLFSVQLQPAGAKPAPASGGAE